MTRLLLVVLVACGSGGQSAPSHPSHAQGSAEPAVHVEPANDCDRLIAHAVDLGVAETHAPPPDRDKLEAALRAKHGPACRELSHDAYACALAATTLDAFAGCQASRNSSTSNSSVAPPGMSPPPTPRSP